MKKAVKLRKTSLSTYKKKLWNIFSEYIRLRDSNPDGFIFCVTCDSAKPWKEAHASHFLSGRNNGVLFDERGVHASCARCNIFEHGNVESYYPFMLEKYGQDVIDELKFNKKNPPKLDSLWYEGKILEYTAKCALQRVRLGI